MGSAPVSEWHKDDSELYKKKPMYTKGAILEPHFPAFFGTLLTGRFSVQTEFSTKNDEF